MFKLSDDIPGSSQLLLGNEAIARGALEAGVQFCSAYPGTPSNEILGSLAPVAKEMGIYVEWMVNEKVATEGAAAASFAGLRSMTAMKNAGMNVASDFLQHHNLSGIGNKGGGMVVVVCDDPGGHSSSDELDTRWIAKSADVPLLVPDDAQDAKELMKWAFELSETYKVYCVLRSYTRLSHSTGIVKLGELPRLNREAAFDTSQIITPETPFIVELHKAAHKRLDKIQEVYESSPFNRYEGPDSPELLIICCGSGSPCSRDAIDLLKLEDFVGVLKLATLWPFPKRLVRKHLSRAKQVLVVEETEPFVELHVKEVVADSEELAGKVKVYGQGSGHITHCGEVTPDEVTEVLSKIFKKEYVSRNYEYAQKVQNLGKIAPRGAIFCPGCPERAGFWCLKEALRKDGRNGFAVGDVGCYTLDIWPYGYQVSRILHGMGTGLGLGSGFGQLGQFGFNQPVVSVCGDSTFFHSSMPALIDAIHCNSNMIAVVMDNGSAAMTGFQSHPGTPVNAVGDPAPAVDIADFCRSLGCKVAVQDPFDIKGTTDKILEFLKDEQGVRVLVLLRTCELTRMRIERKKPYKVWVDEDKCKERERCDYCTRVFACPGLTFDPESRTARIVEGVCTGCGVCVDICPSKAIFREETA